MLDLSPQKGTLSTQNVLVGFILLVLLGMLSSNVALTEASVLVLLLMVKLLFRRGEPPVLLYAMGYQWFQASVLIFRADLGGVPLEAVDTSASIAEATWLTLIGLLFVTLGMRLAIGQRLSLGDRDASVTMAGERSVKRLFIASILALGLSSVLSILAYFGGGFKQPILTLGWVHWVVVYIFVYTALTQRRGYVMLGVIFFTELLVGFLGFFSEFKSILMVFLIAALAAPGALRGARLRVVAVVGVFVVGLGIVWSCIKVPYRDFLNQGTGQQVVLVPVEDRIDKLAELVGSLTWEKLGEGGDILMKRLTYVHYFGESMETVPSRIPYENGQLWKEAILNPLMPRVLVPTKRVLDDSVRTARYTATAVGMAEDGASVSLGYVAESYIDFGPLLMMVPLFFWGAFLGLGYRILTKPPRTRLLGNGGATTVICLVASVLEQSNAKLVGGVFLGFIVMYLVQKYQGKRFLQLVSRMHDAPRV